MDSNQVQTALEGLPLGDIRWYEKIASTNDEATAWAGAGAPDLALVVASEQTAGRGRSGRTWLSPPGSSLSFSLVICPGHVQPSFISRFTALGAVSVAASLQAQYALPARIKWPNDVLVYGNKVCGVLAEASWQDDRLLAVILGIGINVASDPSMTAALTQSGLAFPAASLQDILHQPVDPLEVLRAVLKEMIFWLPQLETQTFLDAWETNLAFRSQWVRVERALPAQSGQESSLAVLEGELLGLAQDGSLRLRTPSGEQTLLQTGEVHLRSAKPLMSAGIAAS